MLGGSTMARAKIESVISVDAVGDCGEMALLGEMVKRGEEFVLAEVATVGSVGAIVGIFHFVRFDKFVVNGGRADEIFEHHAVVGGKTGRERGDGECSLADGFVRGPGEISGVCAAGKRYQERRNFREIG